jgi:putative ABC transport system ATP-binding protein
MSSATVRASEVVRRFRRGPHPVVLAYPEVVLEPGELVAVTGPSLTGKTILVDLLAGWDRPDGGTIVWDGGSPEPLPWPRLTVIPQGFAVLDELTVMENIVLADRVAGRRPPDADRLHRLLDVLGLDRLQGRGIGQVSVGERQRTMVARALVDRPEVVLADEPVAHQDRRHADAVFRLLREAAAVDGAACLVATRDPAVADIADRTIRLAPPGQP